MKKILIGCITALIAVGGAALAFCGCESQNSTSGGNTPGIIGEEKSISFSQTGVSVQLYDTVKLNPVLLNVDARELTWSSDNEAVAKVAQDGTVKPVSVGSAKITVTDGEYSATVTVTVPENIIVPVLTVDESASVLTGKTYKLGISVTFNGKEVEGDFNIRSLDQKKATVTAEGVITGVSAGTTQVVVEGSYNGYIFEERVVEVTVLNDVDIRLTESDITLYTSNPSGMDLQTSEQIGCEVYVNGAKINAPVLSWSSESEGVASVVDGRVSAVKKGTARIVCSYSYGAETYSAYLSVNVDIPVVAVAEPLEFSLAEINGEKSFALPSDFDSEKFISVTVDGAALDPSGVTAYAGAVGVTKEVLSPYVGVHTVNFESENVIYRYQAEITTLYVREYADFAKISANASASTLDGYYVLKNDIDLSGMDAVRIYCGGWTNDGSKGFIGTFDGKGHVLYNAKIAKGGLFYCVGAKGVIKNLGLVGATGTSDNDFALASEFRGTIDNCMVLSDTLKYVSYLSGAAVISNSYFYLGGEDSKIVQTVFDSTTSLLNIYSVTRVTTLNNMNIPISGSLSASIAELKSATVKTDFIASGFNGEYWSVENGLPVFSSYFEKISAPNYFKVYFDNYDLLAGQQTQLTANIIGTTYSLKTAIVGVTVSENGLISLDNTVTGTFTVTAVSPYGQEIEIAFNASVTIVHDNTSIRLNDIDLSEGTHSVTISGIEGSITAFSVGGGKKMLLSDGAFAVTGESYTFTTDKLLESLGKSYGDTELWIFTESDGYTHVWKYSVTLATKIIDSADDLTAITNANKDTKIVDAYYILAADIDASTAGITVSGKAGTQTWTADNIVRFVSGDYSMSEGGFAGIFDGRGHVISNLNTFAYKYQGTGGLFGQLLTGSQVKNVAFTDVVINGRFGAMLVGESCGFNGLLENVVITVKAENITPYTGQAKDYTKILWKLSGGEIKNCLFVGVEQIAFDTEVTTVTNAMSVTTSENEAVKSNGGFNASGTKYSAQPNYTSVNAMLSALATDNKLQSWGDITYINGAIYYGEAVVVLPELIAESTATGKEVARGASITFTTDEYTSLSLKETVAGVTFEIGVLTVADSVLDNTQIVIVATSTLNASVTKELFTYTVIRNYTETALTGTYDLSLENETSSVTLSEAIEGSVEKVKAGANVITTGVSFTGGQLIFTKTALQSLLGEKAYAEGLAIEIYTSADKKYTATVNIATMFIDSAEDLTAITNANTAANIDAYYIVTADIDASTAGITVNCANGNTYNNVVRFVNNDTQSSTTVGFAGIFDGRGHVISNINSYAYVYNGLGGLFGQLLSGSQVKNVAFTNVTAVGRYGTILVGESQKFYGTIENVVITVKGINLQGSGPHTCAYIVADLSGGTFENCLFVGVGTNSTGGSSGSATNVMTVASVRQDTGGFSWTGNAAYNAQPVYASAEAMLTALATDNKLQNWGDITYNAEENAIYFGGTAVVVQSTAE